MLLFLSVKEFRKTERTEKKIPSYFAFRRRVCIIFILHLLPCPLFFLFSFSVLNSSHSLSFGHFVSHIHWSLPFLSFSRMPVAVKSFDPLLVGGLLMLYETLLLSKSVTWCLVSYKKRKCMGSNSIVKKPRLFNRWYWDSWRMQLFSARSTSRVFNSDNIST